MPRFPLRFVVLGVACALVVALAFAACGGEEEAGTASPAATAARTVTQVATGTSQAAGTPTASGRIAFVSKRDGNEEIYVMNADGTGQTNLTNNPGQDKDPAWSPDGSRIAFVSGVIGEGDPEDLRHDIYVMNADGTGRTNLTHSPANDDEPAWSRDGSRIAFVSDRDNANGEIYVMNADGTGQTNLTNNPDWDDQPACSPDGSQIAFRSFRDDNNGEIYVMNVDGTNQTRVSNNLPDRDAGPAWSPDGSKIAFACEYQLCIVNPDGTGHTRLPAGAWSAPAWSPDGSQIAFQSRVVGEGLPGWYMAIFVMSADGTGLTNLTEYPATGVWPVWSADGSQIAFVSDRDGNEEIYVMNADGTGQTNLTNNPAYDTSPTWSP